MFTRVRKTHALAATTDVIRKVESVTVYDPPPFLTSPARLESWEPKAPVQLRPASESTVNQLRGKRAHGTNCLSFVKWDCGTWRWVR
jgi:hypothetical protein